MAVGVAVSSQGKAYPGKLTGKVIWTCIVAAMGGLIFGYDIGISGGVTSMPSFLRKFFPEVYMQQGKYSEANQYCKFNSFPLTMFTSSLYLAALVSCLVASAATRKFGRKWSMVFGGVLFLIGAILNGFAENIAMLIVGRIFLGLGIGFANQAVPLYLSEMAPYKARGALNMMFQLSITIGILSANVLNYFFAKIKGGWGWRLSLGGATMPALMFIIGSLYLPDTPNSLIERGKVQEAKERLQKIRGVANVDEELDDMVEASRVSKLVEHPWRKLMQRNYRPHLTFALGIPFFQQLTGINVIMFYAPVLFKTIGFEDNASLMSAVITGGVNCVATLMSIFTVDKLGRRFWFLEGGTQMFLAQVTTAILIAIKFGTSGNATTLSANYAGSMVGVICVFVSAFAWSWGPLGWLVPSEIFPLEIRSAAQSINVSVNMLFTFAVAQIFLQMLCHLKFGLFLFFAFFELVMSVFIYCLLPETKNIPIEEMGQVWRSHWYWKKFVPEEEGPKEVELVDDKTEKDDIEK